MSAFVTFMLVKFAVVCVIAFIAGFMGWIE